MKRPARYACVMNLVLLALLLFWLANRALDGAVLVVPGTAGKPELIRGGAIALRLWPVMLAGVIPVLTVTACLALRVLRAADGVDTAREIARLRQEAEQARMRADNAEREAAARYEIQRQRAEQVAQKAARQIQEASTREMAADAVIAQAQQEVIRITKLAERQTADAQRRQRNAMGAAERRRRKLEKLAQDDARSA